MAAMGSLAKCAERLSGSYAKASAQAFSALIVKNRKRHLQGRCYIGQLDGDALDYFF
jgi:hypothetical protein